MPHSIHWKTEIFFKCICFLSLTFCVLHCKVVFLRMIACPFAEKLPSALSGSSELEECIHKGYSVLTNGKIFVSVGHRFSTASKGIFLFPSIPLRDQNKIGIKAVSLLCAPFKMCLILSAINSSFQEFIRYIAITFMEAFVGHL